MLLQIIFRFDRRDRRNVAKTASMSATEGNVVAPVGKRLEFEVVDADDGGKLYLARQLEGGTHLS